MKRTEIEERKHLVKWLESSVMRMDLDSLRFTACIAALRTMSLSELDALAAALDKIKREKEKHVVDQPGK